MEEFDKEMFEEDAKKTIKAKKQTNKKYKIKYGIKRAKSDLRSSIIFFLIGMIFTIFVGHSTVGGIFRKIGKDGITECTKVEIDMDYNSEGNSLYKPSFYYNVDGIEYVYEFPYYINLGYDAMRENKYIYYDLENPEKCVASYETELRFENTFVFGIVLIFPITGIYAVKESLKKIKLINEREGNNDEIRNDNL